MILLALIIVGLMLVACAFTCKAGIRTMRGLDIAMDAFYRAANRLADQHTLPAEVGAFLYWLSKNMWKRSSFVRLCVVCHYSRSVEDVSENHIVQAIDRMNEKQRAALFEAVGYAMVVSTLRTPVVGSFLRWRMERRFGKEGYRPNVATVAKLARHVPHAA